MAKKNAKNKTNALNLPWAKIGWCLLILLGLLGAVWIAMGPEERIKTHKQSSRLLKSSAKMELSQRWQNGLEYLKCILQQSQAKWELKQKYQRIIAEKTAKIEKLKLENAQLNNNP